MENNYFSLNIYPAFERALNDRELKIAALFMDICDFFGLTTSPEQTTDNFGSPLSEFEYQLAISG